jgi:hypothetical protein
MQNKQATENKSVMTSKQIIYPFYKQIQFCGHQSKTLMHSIDINDQKNFWRHDDALAA